MAGVQKGRGRELRRETSRAQVPPSPSPFNACHTGCIRSRNWNNLTVEPLLWYSSIQGTPPLREHRIWSQKNVQIIFVFVTSIEETPLLSGTQNLLPQKCSHKLCFVSSIEGTPLFRGQKIWFHKKIC